MPNAPLARQLGRACGGRMVNRDGLNPT